MLSWSWDFTATKSLHWSSSEVRSESPGGSTTVTPPSTPLSPYFPITSSSTNNLGMHLQAGLDSSTTWHWPAELATCMRSPVFPGMSPVVVGGMAGTGSPGSAVPGSVGPASPVDEEDVFSYKQQLRTEQLVQAYMDAVRQSMDDDPAKQQPSEMPTTDTPAIRYLQQLLPFAYPPGILPEMPVTQDDGKPLDLSASSQCKKTAGDETTSPEQLSKPSVELKVPQIMKSGKRKELNGKKTYTEEELAAAVSDIRSGKLGTRRAAVLYGIPRSTLRNKIFKLESEQNQAAENGKPLENKLSMVDLLQGIPNGEFPAAGFGFGEESLLPNKFLNFSGEEIWEQKLEQIRRKHNLLEPDRKFGMPPMHFSSNHHLTDFEKSYFGSPFGSDLQLAFLPELVRKMAEERMEMERQHHQSWQSLQLDLRLNNRGLHGLAPNGGLNNNNANVELKIPSYKPVRTTYMNGFGSSSNHHHDNNTEQERGERSQTQSSNSSMTPKIGDTLKDIIAKTIAEKMRTRAMMNNTMHQLNINSNLGCQNNNPGPLSSDSSSMSSNDMGPSSEKRARLSPKENHSNPDSDQKDAGDAKNGKKTRPKRGQYRKYNSQLLLEAVRAVQRGEMSVHRAGSYFGVPHSTLEYKVKERHLLRHKKPREGRSKKEGGLVSPSPSAAPAPTTPNSQSGSRSETPVSLSPPLPTNSAMSVISNLANQARDPSSLGRMGNSLSLGLGAWSSPTNGSMSLLPTDPSLSAYPAGFALNTSASELLKKLQRKVQAKAAMAETGSTEEMAAALRAAAAMAAAASSVVSTSSSSSSPPPPSSNQGNTSTEATQVAAQ